MSYLSSLKNLISRTETSNVEKKVETVNEETLEPNMANKYMGAQDMHGHLGFRRNNTFSSLFDNVDHNKIKDGRYRYFWQHQYFKGSSQLADNRIRIVIQDEIPKNIDAVDIIQNPVLIVKGDILKQLGSVDKNNMLERLIVKRCEIEIGGMGIDRVYDLQNYFFNQVLGNNIYDNVNKNVADTGVLYIPLAFDMLWNDSYIPLNYLKHHLVKFNIHFNHENIIQRGLGLNDNEMIDIDNKSIDYKLKLDGIVLSPEHRKEIAHKSHEHIIKTYQYTGQEDMTVNIFNQTAKQRLYFNHPCMGILIYFTSYKKSFINDDMIDFVELKLDGKTIYKIDGDILKCDGFYHMGLKDTDKLKGYYWIPFSRINDRLDKKHDQISYSTINMSRVDDITLQFKFKKKKEQLEWPIPDTDLINSYWGKVYDGGVSLHCHALNAHVMRYMSGMGGLAFSK